MTQPSPKPESVPKIAGVPVVLFQKVSKEIGQVGSLGAKRFQPGLIFRERQHLVEVWTYFPPALPSYTAHLGLQVHRDLSVEIDTGLLPLPLRRTF